MGLIDKVFKMFSPKEKLEHYSKVAKGEKGIKENSKFSREEQIAYARGQRDARLESARNYAYKNATPEQREAYKQKRRESRKSFKHYEDN